MNDENRSNSTSTNGFNETTGESNEKIMGKPMLWYLVKRVEKSKYIDKIIIATTLNKKDDAIEEFTKFIHRDISKK